MENDSTNTTSIKKTSHYLSSKAVSLLSCPVTKQNHQKQAEAIRVFLDKAPFAYYLNDLANALTIIDTISRNVDEYPPFEALLWRALEKCQYPPILCKSSEILVYERDLQELFSLLGFLSVFLVNHRKFVLDLIKSLLTCRMSPECHCINLEWMRKAAENSRLHIIWSEMVLLAEDDIYPDLLQLISIMIDKSSDFCLKLLKNDILNNLLIRLEANWRERLPNNPPPDIPSPEEQLCFYEETSTILWTLLKSIPGDGKEVHERMPRQFALWNLRYAFRLFLRKKSKPVDVNNVVALVLKMLDVFPHLEIVNSGLASDFVTVINIFNKGKKMNTKLWCRNISFDPNFNNIYLLLTLLLSLKYFSNYYSGIHILETEYIMQGLLSLMANKQAIKWDFRYLEVLLVVTTYVLAEILPNLLEDFIELNGPAIYLDLLKTFYSNLYIANICVGTLAFMRKINSEICTYVIEAIIQNQGVNIILDFANFLLKKDFMSIEDQQCIANTCCILHIICSYSSETHTQNFSEFILGYMRRTLNPSRQEPLQTAKVLVCFLDYVNVCLCNNSVTYNDVLEKGGVYLLLDIIQTATFPVKIMGLLILINFCQDDASIPFLVTWQGKNGTKLMQLLMRIFKEECDLLGVEIKDNGEILNLKMPLAGKQQTDEYECQCEKTFGNPAIVDMMVSCRPKIYAIIQLLNAKSELCALANGTYRIYGDVRLSLKEKVIAVMAQNFLALKLGEVWEEIAMELEILKCKPVVIDAEILRYLRNRHHEWVALLALQQRHLIQKDLKKSSEMELRLYDDLMEAKLSQSLSALDELTYIAKCSEKLFRLTKKCTLGYKMERIRSTDITFNTFSTDFHSIMSQSISMQLENERKNKVFPLKLVSPDNSEEEELTDIEFATPLTD